MLLLLRPSASSCPPVPPVRAPYKPARFVRPIKDPITGAIVELWSDATMRPIRAGGIVGGGGAGGARA